MSRCRMLAEGSVACILGGPHPASPIAGSHQLQHFAASGTSLDRPYFNLASTNSYEFPQ